MRYWRWPCSTWLPAQVPSSCRRAGGGVAAAAGSAEGAGGDRGRHRGGHAQGEERRPSRSGARASSTTWRGTPDRPLRCAASKSWARTRPSGREGRRELRLLPADGEQHDVAPERLPPSREARPGHGPASAPQAGPVLVVGRGVLLGHLEQRLRPPGQGDDRARVEPPCLQVQAHGRAQGLRRVVQPPRRLDRARRRRLPAGRREDERGPEAGGEDGVAAAGNGGERLGHEAELDGVRGRRDLQGPLPHACRTRAPAPRARARARRGRRAARPPSSRPRWRRAPGPARRPGARRCAGGRPGSRAPRRPRRRPGRRSRARRPTRREGGRR